MSWRSSLWSLVAMTSIAVAAPVAAQPDVRAVPHAGGPGTIGPPPPPGNVELVLDDGTAESSVGVDVPAREFLWLNVFPRPAPLFTLDEVRVLFPFDSGVTVGDAIQLVVYTDPDGDPTNGADLVATFDEVVQAADGLIFSVYPLVPAPTIDETSPGEVLVGVVPRFIESGVDPDATPAALDTDTASGRSYLATWTGDPPNPPVLPPDQLITPIDTFIAGTWLIRASATTLAAPTVLEIPTLGPGALALLVALLAAAGVATMTRRRPHVVRARTDDVS